MVKHIDSDYADQLKRRLVPLLGTPSVAQRVLAMADAVMALAMLDLGPAKSLLSSCYSSRKGGRKARPPVPMLRSLIVMGMAGITSINKWVSTLRGRPELGVLSGFDLEDTPGVGTYYDFFDRLLDGPQPPPCAHVQRPSARRKGSRGRFRRGLKKEKARQKAEQAKQAPEGPVRSAVEAALEQINHALPGDLTTRLQQILMHCAVVPSAEMGFLGDIGKLDVAADGSVLGSQASGRGHRLPDADESEVERYYADPDATWGYDSYRECYVFGHYVHALTTINDHGDLPLFVGFAPAHSHDGVLAPDHLSRLLRLMNQALPGAKLRSFIGDTAYDARALYEMVVNLDAAPIIPLHPNSQTLTDANDLPRDKNGIPLCPGHLSMRLHGYNKRTDKVVYNCPVKRPGREQGRLVMRTHLDECPLGALCEPNTKMGPSVYLGVSDDPRLNPPIPRGSKVFEELMNKRTSAERFFGWLKGAGRLGQRPYRRGHIFAITGTCLAICAHARAWVRRNFSGGIATVDDLRDALTRLTAGEVAAAA